MDFDQIADTGRYQFQYCVTQNSSGCYACDTSSVWVVMNNTGVKNNEHIESLTIWPNPLQQGFWTISALPHNGYYEIYATSGKVVSKGRVLQNKNTKIEVQSMEKGTHLISIRLENGSYYQGYLIRR
jgi:hypothetical protein